MSHSDLKHFFFEVSKDPALQQSIVQLAKSKGLTFTDADVKYFAEQNGRDKNFDYKKGQPPPKLSGK